MANHSDRGTALSKTLRAVFGTLSIFLVMLPPALTQACASYDTCPGPEHVDFHLVAEKKECADDSGVLKGRYHTVDECADACRGREPFVHFIFAISTQIKIGATVTAASATAKTWSRPIASQRARTAITSTNVRVPSCIAACHTCGCRSMYTI